MGHCITSNTFPQIEKLCAFTGSYRASWWWFWASRLRCSSTTFLYSVVVQSALRVSSVTIEPVEAQGLKFLRRLSPSRKAMSVHWNFLCLMTPGMRMQSSALIRQLPYFSPISVFIPFYWWMDEACRSMGLAIALNKLPQVDSQYAAISSYRVTTAVLCISLLVYFHLCPSPVYAMCDGCSERGEGTAIAGKSSHLCGVHVVDDYLNRSIAEPPLRTVCHIICRDLVAIPRQ